MDALGPVSWTAALAAPSIITRVIPFARNSLVLLHTSTRIRAAVLRSRAGERRVCRSLVGTIDWSSLAAAAARADAVIPVVVGKRVADSIIAGVPALKLDDAEKQAILDARLRTKLGVVGSFMDVPDQSQSEVEHRRWMGRPAEVEAFTRSDRYDPSRLELIDGAAVEKLKIGARAAPVLLRSCRDARRVELHDDGNGTLDDALAAVANLERVERLGIFWYREVDVQAPSIDAAATALARRPEVRLELVLHDTPPALLRLLEERNVRRKLVGLELTCKHAGYANLMFEPAAVARIATLPLRTLTLLASAGDTRHVPALLTSAFASGAMDRLRALDVRFIQIAGADAAALLRACPARLQELTVGHILPDGFLTGPELIERLSELSRLRFLRLDRAGAGVPQAEWQACRQAVRELFPRLRNASIAVVGPSDDRP